MRRRVETAIGDAAYDRRAGRYLGARAFELTKAFRPGTQTIYLDGVELPRDAYSTYPEAGQVIFAEPPPKGMRIVIEYDEL